MTAGLWVEDDDLGFTGVSRTSSIFGGSRTRSVLGGSGLGGDDRALVAAPMGAISLVLGCDLAGVSGGAISPMLGVTRLCFWCDLHAVSLSLSLLFSWGRIHLKVNTNGNGFTGSEGIFYG